MDEASTPQPRPIFCWHGVHVVLHTGVGEAVKCEKCAKEWDSRDAYFKDASTLDAQYVTHLMNHGIWREGAEL